MHRIQVTLCALMLFAGVARAGIDNAGTTAGNFLSVGSGAAVLSMGGATLGAGSDLNAAAWNPAALAYVNAPQFSLSHAALALQSSQDWVAGGGRLGRGATRWSADALYQSDGGFEGRDAFGASTGSFNVSNMAFGLHLARPLSQGLVAGAGFHWVSENLGDASGSGLGLDAGVQGRSGAFGFGAAARNVGGKMKYSSASYDLPSVFGLGASWTHAPSGVRLAVDANFPRAYYNDVRMGAEWMWQDRLALRAGYRMELGAAAGEPLGGPSFGMGAGTNGVWVDYGFLAGASEAQGQPRFGLTFHPGFLNPGGEPVAVAAPNAPPAEEPVAARASAPRAAPANVARVEPVVKPLHVTLPSNALASDVDARAVVILSSVLAPSKPVHVTKLEVPRDPPMARDSAPAPAAPRPGKSDAQVASAPAPAVVVVTPSSAPSSDPIPPKSVQAPPAPKPQVRPTTVVARSGETLAELAKRWDTSVAAIMMENNLVTENVKPGRTLKLPPRR